MMAEHKCSLCQCLLLTPEISWLCSSGGTKVTPWSSRILQVVDEKGIHVVLKQKLLLWIEKKSGENLPGMWVAPQIRMWSETGKHFYPLQGWTSSRLWHFPVTLSSHLVEVWISDLALVFPFLYFHFVLKESTSGIKRKIGIIYYHMSMFTWFPCTLLTV